MVRVLGVHHAQIGIPNGAEPEARAFYCGVLGLTEIPKPASVARRGGFWLQLGALQIHVSIDNGADRRGSRAHLGYEVDDLAALREKLSGAGVAVEDGLPPIPGFSRFELRDPFGNRVEFLQRA
ncbi:MAG TPA: VOC family protein [bacterium]